VGEDALPSLEFWESSLPLVVVLIGDFEFGGFGHVVQIPEL
jgi:hypothetical protein